MNSPKEDIKIAIIGGGVAGASAGLYFGKMGLDVTLFEKEPTLISGPPWCHLHAGGNLYREISDAQCIALLKQSIDFLRFYPYVVDYRPTVIVLPKSDNATPQDLLPRLELLTQAYEEHISKDAQNEVLGKPQNYYRLYTKAQIEALKNQPIINQPQSADAWMSPVAHTIDLDKVQFPLILVQEYGLNLFRLASGVMSQLENLPSVSLQMQTVVEQIDSIDKGWEIGYSHAGITKSQHFDYLINAAGFRTGKIDDMVDAPCQSMVEFKAAYISHWEEAKNQKFPEIIFHGERGTPQGMGQFTPYPNGYFQLHGMTHDITLYDDGLVTSSPVSCQPKLGQNFISKIETSWSKEEVHKRTTTAIGHLAQYIPTFKDATVGSKPLFGAQQIPGNDPTLRVAEVSFPLKRYARCEIVKVSSVLDMIDAISEVLIGLGFLDKQLLAKRSFNTHPLEENLLDTRAKQIALMREYPEYLAQRTTPTPTR